MFILFRFNFFLDVKFLMYINQFITISVLMNLNYNIITIELIILLI